MISPEFEALFVRTLAGKYDDEGPWEAVGALRVSGSREVFDHAATWCESSEALKRARAANILSQFRRLPENPKNPEWMFRNEAYLLITEMLGKEREDIVIDSAIHALGHLQNPDAIPLIVRHQDHPNKDVRFAASCALGRFPNDPQSIRALLKLTSDVDGDVRDWAVFGLGVQGEADSPEIRDTLLRCLDDPDEDVREEAAVGLSKRRDQRLIPKLLTMLDGCNLKSRVAEAAMATLDWVGDPPEWETADYRAALIEKFAISD